MSAQHPEWAPREWEYVASHANAGVPDRHPRAVGPAFKGDVKGATQLAEYVDRLNDPARRDAAILELLDSVGPEAMRPSDAASTTDLADADERRKQRIRDLVWLRICAAHLDARAAASLDEQRAAQRFLKDVGKALAGDRRGKRSTTDALAVRAFYYARLYQLERASELLAAWPWPARRKKKIELVATACGLPPSDVYDHFLGKHVYLAGDDVIDVEEHPKRPLTRKEQARIWTAGEFGITQQTVLNLLAPSGLALSPK